MRATCSSNSSSACNKLSLLLKSSFLLWCSVLLTLTVVRFSATVRTSEVHALGGSWRWTVDVATIFNHSAFQQAPCVRCPAASLEPREWSHLLNLTLGKRRGSGSNPSLSASIGHSRTQGVLKSGNSPLGHYAVSFGILLLFVCLY